MKEKFYRHYWWIALLISLPLFWTTFDLINKELAFSLLGVILTSVFLVQKQKLEELKVFRELFNEFNEKYEKLNDVLNDIYIEYCSTDKENEVISQDKNEYDTLVDYFNLCAEEYYYFKQGVIPKSVWNNWRNGMKYYYECIPIKKLWDEEIEIHKKSYYNFSTSLLINKKK